MKASTVIMGRKLEEVVSRLDALMMVLKSCKADTCRHPWRSIHPRGDVSSLEDALKPTFDAFYANQSKVSFSKCELGYIKESEGPQNVLAFGEELGDSSKFYSPEEQKPLVIDPDWSIWA